MNEFTAVHPLTHYEPGPPDSIESDDGRVTVWAGKQEYLARHEDTGLEGSGETKEEAIATLLDELNRDNREERYSVDPEPRDNN